MMADLGIEPGHAETRRLAAITHGYDYFATVWLDGPLRLAEPALGAWLADLALVAPAVAERCASLVHLVDDGRERAAADEDFQRCLVVPQPGHYLPPYASAWIDDAEALWSPATMRVLRCYSRAGLDWHGPAYDSDRPWVRAPDHLGIECAFIAELTAGSAQRHATGPDPTGSYDPGEVAASFVVDHMRTWVPAYATEFADRARSRYWRHAIEVLAAWLQQDSLLPTGARLAPAKPAPAPGTSSPRASYAPSR